jgi:hypothetical protein
MKDAEFDDFLSFSFVELMEARATDEFSLLVSI